MVFATVGTFATGGSFSDLMLLYVLGLLGVLMALAKVPVAPAIVGLILGPLFEEQALRAVLLEGGSISGLFSTPLSIVLWLIALVALVVPLVLALRRRVGSDAERESAMQH